MNVARRRFLFVSSLALSMCAPHPILAQTRAVRIGILATRANSTYLPGLVKRFAELGFVEGKNMSIAYRSADGIAERFPVLALELTRSKPDLIFAIGPEQPTRALYELKSSIPVVMLAIDFDPVKAGIVSSLRRPGGQFTGIVLLQSQLAAKRLELLREVVPQAKRIVVLADAFSMEQLEAVRVAAATLGVELVVESFAAPPYDIESAFRRAAKVGVDAALPLTSPVFFDQLATTFQVAMTHRLPTVGTHVRHAEAGHLLSYGVNPVTGVARAADIAVRILKGAKPGEIPVEQPTHFELVVNLKTAKALGLTLRPEIMVRATRVIQ